LGEGLRGKQRSRPPAADSVCKDLWSEPFARCRCGVERRASGARCPMQMLWTRFLEGSFVVHENRRMWMMTMMMTMMMNEDDDDVGDDDHEHDEVEHEHIEMMMTNMMMIMMMMMTTMLRERGV